MNDRVQMRGAFQAMGFSAAEVAELLTVVAAVLHLGQMQYTATTKDTCAVADHRPAQTMAALLGIPGELLLSSLTHKTVVSRTEAIKGDLSASQAAYARDALAKSLCVAPFLFI